MTSPADTTVGELEQLQLVSPGPPGPVRGPWVRPCAVPGPYCVRRPTPKMPNRLELLSCTRPEGHPGAFHQYADPSRGVLAQWSRDGQPDYPPLVAERSSNGSSRTV